jgi:MFS transporter, DHA1 family, inner membrane transport protein
MPSSVLPLMLCVFSFTTGEFVVAGILPDVAGDLAVSIPTTGLLVTAYATGMIVGGPLLTALTTRFARKRLLLALVAVGVAGNLASALAPDYAVLFAARVVSAFVVATFFAVAVVTATSMAAPGKQASTVAKLAFGMNLGMILGAPIGTVIGHSLGWRATFLAIAALTAIALAIDREAGAGPAAGHDRLCTRRAASVPRPRRAAGDRPLCGGQCRGPCRC